MTDSILNNAVEIELQSYSKYVSDNSQPMETIVSKANINLEQLQDYVSINGLEKAYQEIGKYVIESLSASAGV